MKKADQATKNVSLAPTLMVLLTKTDIKNAIKLFIQNNKNKIVERLPTRPM